MATFALIHGSGDVGWYWHLVEAELRGRDNDVVTPDLPCDDDAAELSEYADTVLEAIGDRRDLVVVAQSAPRRRSFVTGRPSSSSCSSRG